MNRELFMDHCRRGGFEVAEPSCRVLSGSVCGIAKKDGKKRFLVSGGPNDNLKSDFSGEETQIGDMTVLVCSLSEENAAALRKHFPFTAPVSLKGKKATIGLGDRLGIATGAHIAAIAGTGVFPVLAQQSKRELTLTGRTNRSMLDDVAWQVFEAGYEGGYAADGDHLKTLEEVKAAVADGDTMITLDCSEHIDNDAGAMGDEEVVAAYREDKNSVATERLDSLYLGRKFHVGGFEITFSEAELARIYLIYGDALVFAKKVFREAVVPCGHPVSLEISIDETETETTPNAHYFVASELLRKGVAFESMAPRFCGEFQKGIDYIGDPEQFKAEFSVHAQIAAQLGYRISVHSGSDKFSVFPCIGELSNGVFHLKTSGTSWVEAVRVIAMCDPALFRRMIKFSCTKYQEAKKFYHVSGMAEKIPPIDSVPDQELPALVSESDTRQVMHITYGFLLQEKDQKGNYIFRDDIYKVLEDNRQCMEDVLSAHIRKHIDYLGVK